MLSPCKIWWYVVWYRQEAIFVGLETEKLFLRPSKAAQLIDTSRQTLYNWMRLPGFPVYRIGGSTLIAADELVEWIKTQGR